MNCINPCALMEHDDWFYRQTFKRSKEVVAFIVKGHVNDCFLQEPYNRDVNVLNLGEYWDHRAFIVIGTSLYMCICGFSGPLCMFHAHPHVGSPWLLNHNNPWWALVPIYPYPSCLFFPLRIPDYSIMTSFVYFLNGVSCGRTR